MLRSMADLELDALTPVDAAASASGRGGAIVALLRGVNVGGRNRIAMADLRRIVEDLGFSEVRTHLQSGNVVFARGGPSGGEDADAIAERIEERLREDLGLSAEVLARTAEDLRRIVSASPLSDIATDPSRLVVTFLSDRVDQGLLREVDPADFLPDVFLAGEREIYVWAPNGVSETKLTHAFWERRLGVTATGRNWKTVQRLLELAGG